MTAEEVGIYMRFLCHSWSKNGLENDEKRLSLLAGQCSGNAVAEAVQVLKRKFEIGLDGRWRNQRQEEVRTNLELYRKQQSEKARKSWKNRPNKNHLNDLDKGRAAASAPALAGQCSPSPSPLNREREAELENPHHFPEVSIPSWDEVKLWAEMDGVPEATAREFFDHENSFGQWRAGGKINGMPINARNAMKVWFNRGKKINATNSKSSRPSNDRNAGTYNQDRDLTGAKAKIR